jgi:hypothetical protein
MIIQIIEILILITPLILIISLFDSIKDELKNKNI